MITYTEKHIEKDDIEIFRQIERVVGDMFVPDLGFDEKNISIELSCHMLAEAMSEIFDLKCVRGYYMIGYEHSWLITKNRNIIDVYPWGMVGGPVLIAHNIVNRNGPLYIEDDGLNLGSCTSSYKRSVALTKEAIEGLIAQY